MGKCLFLSTETPVKICQRLLPYNHPTVALKPTKNLKANSPGFNKASSYGFGRKLSYRTLCTKAALSQVPGTQQFFKIAAESTGPIPAEQLMQAVEGAAKVGAQVIGDNVNKPRTINYKAALDLVTDTDKKSEIAVLGYLKKNFPDHRILGEEGGVMGNPTSEYLWILDPVDGTTNFAHGYPCFSCSIGLLYRGKPAAASVIEFSGGHQSWVTHTFTAGAGKGSFRDGERIHVSQTDKIDRALLVTGFGYDHDEAWATNFEIFKFFMGASRGVRRFGSSAADFCHVAMGIAEAYWEHNLRPWDNSAGVLIVEEAGGVVSRMDGGKYSVFDRTCLASNGVIHAKLLEVIGPTIEKLKSDGFDFSIWENPENYPLDP